MMAEKPVIDIKGLTVGPLETNCFIVSCRKTRKALIIDPGGNAEAIAKLAAETAVDPVLIVLTHGHSDHMAAAAPLMRRFGIGLAIHGADIDTMKLSVDDAPMWGMGAVEYPEVTSLLSDNEEIPFGEASAVVMHTPGHTRGGISILAGGAVFAGDTLFYGSIGRTDFFGGDMETLLESVRTRLFTLPDPTPVHCGHGPSTTIGREKAHNPFLTGLVP
jgi:glyoxylase-like metal-dependent hydrolase (beta-lactamase superfamily II)